MPGRSDLVLAWHPSDNGRQDHENRTPTDSTNETTVTVSFKTLVLLSVLLVLGLAWLGTELIG